MKLHEYQSKTIFAKYGIPIPKGRVAATAVEAKHIAEELGGRVVVKSQVLVGGRGKAGGIKVAKSAAEAEGLAQQILAMEIKGLPVRKVLVDEAAAIEHEIYFAITNDRAAKKPVMIASAEGGMDIEEVAATKPERIIKVHIDPLLGLRDYQARDIAASIDLPREHWREVSKIAAGLWQAYLETDATLAEINPLVITKDKRLVALDGKMMIDDNALFRHSDLNEMRDIDEEAPAETEARKFGLSYIKLDGNIGCMVNGAGLAMATMDIIKLYGSSPANFLDVGGGATKERVTAAFKIILKDPNVEGILVNIFGGIMRCDVIAEGVVAAAREVNLHVPLVVRLEGTNVELGKKILKESGLKITSADHLADAAEKIVKAVKEQN